MTGPADDGEWNTEEIRPVSDNLDSATEAIRALLTETAPRQRVLDDHMFTVTGPWAAYPPTFRLQLFTVTGHRPVAVVTQTSDEGASLTNRAEDYLSAVWQRHLPGDAEPPIWIQRAILPAASGMIDCFELVTFTHAIPYTVSSPEWCPLADSDVAELVGAPVDPSRGGGYMPRPVEPDDQLRYKTTWVVRLPRPRPFRKPSCMPAGAPWWRRIGRQLVPLHQTRTCCWYHARDWHRITKTGIRLIDQARRDGIADTDIRDHALATNCGLDVEDLAALATLLSPALGIDLGRRGKDYTNGQHRAQALLDAGVRRTIVISWEPPPSA